MTEPLFKATLRFEADRGGPFSLGCYVPPLLRSHNAARAALLMTRVFEWLEQAGRDVHFANFYDITNDETGQGELVVVLNDRDTALMLKLALG